MRLHLWISGKVQGVGYRDAMVEAATAHGVAGWVRNLPDGRVEAVAEGAPAQLRDLVAWCRRGPAEARVDGVEQREEPAEGLRGFERRRTP
jgi:acylphosphatase